jgi:xylitol oxidase
VSEVNWAGNVVYGARRLHHPTSVEQLREIVTAASRIRVLGSRHSFNKIADSCELVSLNRLPGELRVDRATDTVSCPAWLTYGELARSLSAEGLALANLGSLPHISVAGSVATATHGSGDRNGNLATAVAGHELVTSTGELITTRRGDADFEGLVVGLGALGAVTRVTLDVEPAYEVSQVVYENLSWKSLDTNFDELTAAGYSVSVFTRWGERLLAEIEYALAPFAARPHWGKLFVAEADRIMPLYERAADFTRLVDRLDPRGAFRNDWFEARVLGARG